MDILIFAFLTILEYYQHETAKNVLEKQQEAFFQHRVEDAQKERLGSPDAWRYPPVKEGQNALLPSCNCLEIQAH